MEWACDRARNRIWKQFVPESANKEDGWFAEIRNLDGVIRANVWTMRPDTDGPIAKLPCVSVGDGIAKVESLIAWLKNGSSQASDKMKFCWVPPVSRLIHDCVECYIQTEKGWTIAIG